ncbi:hypothetical protein G6N76_09545 [Rhizobium daejeonense]|uniref:Uncharacterized protein n=1 Tax=Rhizobium daejeonense TaxID=240521 RepID=A0A6M1RXV5_9HYPH|nr:LexA family transcriptional regulator [Rhizobium daejeonense]NGO63919.1 hypothetical protein [Rhizobium daejeonense]
MKYKDIAIALAEKIGNPTKAAKVVGVSQPTYRAWTLGGEIKGDNLMSLLEAAEAHGIIKAENVRLIGGNTNTVALRELDTRAGAGGGGVDSSALVSIDNGVSIQEDAFRDGVWEMPSAFLNYELKVSASGAIVAEVVGDSGYDPENSNAPGSLLPGDRVIIDSRDIRPSPPGPFAVFDGLGLVIKLVEVVRNSDPPRLRLSSRNPSYPPYEVTTEEAHIIGRVKGRITRM